MTVTVTSVHVPAWSTIGCGSGYDEEGRLVRFVGEPRYLYDIGEAIEDAESIEDCPQVELEGWQIIDIREVA